MFFICHDHQDLEIEVSSAFDESGPSRDGGRCTWTRKAANMTNSITLTVISSSCLPLRNRLSWDVTLLKPKAEIPIFVSSSTVAAKEHKV